MVSKTLKESIQEILNNGITKPKEIKQVLERQYGKNTTLNSIYALKSNIGKSAKSSNLNVNYDSNLNNLNSNSQMARTQQEQPKQIFQEISPNQTQEAQKQIITGNKFSLNGISAPIHLDGTEMSKA